MKIKVADITDSLEISYKEDDLSFFESIREESQGEIEIKGSVGVDITITNRHHKYDVAGSIKGLICISCSRCLESYSLPFDNGFKVTLAEPAESFLSDAHDIELTYEDLKVEQFSGDEIDLTRIVQEQIVLICPMKPLCKEDCRGLCSQCGSNLNSGDCGCEPEDIETPFSILKNIKE